MCCEMTGENYQRLWIYYYDTALYSVVYTDYIWIISTKN